VSPGVSERAVVVTGADGEALRAADARLTPLLPDRLFDRVLARLTRA